MLSTQQPDLLEASGAALGFSDQRREIVVPSLPIEGEIPAWLTGSLLRNGPARWDSTDGSVNHWFDGMAMLHRFAFNNGSVAYVNKVLRSRASAAFEETGKLAYREFASDPCRSTFGRFATLFDPKLTDNGAVNITKIGEKWLAITESPMAVEFDPRTLDTIGVHQLAPGTQVPVAHLHVDRVAGDLIGLRVAFGLRSSYEIVATDQATGQERLIGSLPAKNPSYQHSFGLTDRYVIISEHSLVVNPLRLALSGKPFIENYQWQPDLGTRFVAMDRKTGAIAGEWTAPASFCFHHVNAFDDEDGSIVVDLVAFDDASIIDALRLENCRDNGPTPASTLRRYRLTPGATAASVRIISEATVELPRNDDRFNRRPYTTVYAAGSTADRSAIFGRILAINVNTGAAIEWSRPGEIPGEPVFVKRPGSTEEGDGVVLTIVLEPELGTSSMVVLDGHTLEEIGRARVPQHIPFGFHGGHVAAL